MSESLRMFGTFIGGSMFGFGLRGVLDRRELRRILRGDEG